MWPCRANCCFRYACDGFIIFNHKREEIAKLERVVDPKKDKPKTYTQKRERITYENSKGETVTVDVLTNIGNRPSGTEYAVLKYSNGRTETFSSKQTFDGRMATIAQRQNVKIETLSESKKERDPEVDRGVILPSSGKRFKRVPPKRKRKLPSNTPNQIACMHFPKAHAVIPALRTQAV